MTAPANPQEPASRPGGETGGPHASGTVGAGGAGSAGGSGSGGPGGPSAPRRSNSRAVAIGTAVAGGLILAVAGTAVAVAAIDARSGATEATRTADAKGVTALDVEVGGADFTVRFGDVDEATLEATGKKSDRWTLSRTGDRLIVESPRLLFDRLCFGWCGDQNRTVVLTLPSELETQSIDADLSLGAGSLRAEGSFGELDLSLGAGDMEVEGSARSLDAEVSAGRLDARLSDVADAVFSISAGRAVAELEGAAPSAVGIEVSAGSIDLTLPDETYFVGSEVSAGSIDNLLRTDPSSRHTVQVELSAGSATLRPAS